MRPRLAFTQSAADDVIDLALKERTLTEAIGRGPHPSAALAAMLVAFGLALAGCGRGGSAWRSTAALTPAAPEESGYLHPPTLQKVQRLAGGVVLFGRSDPAVRVRLSSPPPKSTAYGATSSDRGEWSIMTPSAADVGLFGVAEELAGRDVQGEGYVAILPAPGPAGVLLRAGGGAAVLADKRPAGLAIAAVDYDGSGAGVVSGLAKPGATVRLFVDTRAAGETRTNERGRFSITPAASFSPGGHEVRVDSGDQTASAKFSLDHPKPITGLPYHGERTPSGWRIDWLTPGGGEQTTLTFDAVEP